MKSKQTRYRRKTLSGGRKRSEKYVFSVNVAKVSDLSNENLIRSRFRQVVRT